MTYFGRKPKGYNMDVASFLSNLHFFFLLMDDEQVYEKQMDSDQRTL